MSAGELRKPLAIDTPNPDSGAKFEDNERQSNLDSRPYAKRKGSVITFASHPQRRH